MPSVQLRLQSDSVGIAVSVPQSFSLLSLQLRLLSLSGGPADRDITVCARAGEWQDPDFALNSVSEQLLNSVSEHLLNSVSEHLLDSVSEH